MIRVGVIGCGKIAQTRHLPEYADNAYAEIAAVYDLDHNRAKEVALRYGAAVYESYEALLEDAGIDAVSVCVANVSHYEVSVAAMHAGKHVLCEKPMAVTLEQCEEMVRISEETGKYLMIGHNQRLTQTHIRAKELIRQGQIGKIITFRTSFGHAGPETWMIDRKNNWFFDKARAQFGALADLGVHKTDLIQFLTGRRIKKVTAKICTLHKADDTGKKLDVDDNAVCIYEMEDGIIGTMTATNYGKEDNSTVLYGTDGVMYIYCDEKYSIMIEKKNGSRECYQLDRIQTNDDQTRSGVIDEWIECLRKKKQPDLSCHEALSAMKAVFAASESSQKGCTVEIR